MLIIYIEISIEKSPIFYDWTKCFSLKAKKSKAIKRRRKVVKQRRRGGYGGGRRRTARKVGSSEESLPFTPKEKQQYIKGKM